nr:retrotransposon protein, putative, Ty1-copia subclass [Tanacetum cinerariifolium]
MLFILNAIPGDGIYETDVLNLVPNDYALESVARILNMVPTKKVDKTPYELCGRAGELKEIQDKDTSPFEITSEIPMEVEGFEPPQEEEAPVRRSERPHRAPNCLCLNVEVEEHSLGDLNEPVNYKAEMVDSEETFSPVADIRAIRILIAIAVFYDYEIWQMDVKTAFLNGYLDEDIYMVQHEGFIDPKHPRKVCKLQRFIYGLKQASRNWNKRFDEEIKRFGFTQNFDEPCVYQKASGRNVTFLILYVDDIIIMGNHIPSLIRLCQSAYMDKILKRYRMDNFKRIYIPMQERLNLNKTQGASTPGEVKRMQNVPYASAIGSIMYAVRCTRPDVVLAQNITSRFQQNPGEPHWTAVKTILKYLRNTKDMFLVYDRNP